MIGIRSLFQVIFFCHLSNYIIITLIVIIIIYLNFLPHLYSQIKLISVSLQTKHDCDFADTFSPTLEQNNYIYLQTKKGKIVITIIFDFRVNYGSFFSPSYVKKKDTKKNFRFLSHQPESDCIYQFPIDFEPNKFQFGHKSNGKW